MSGLSGDQGSTDNIGAVLSLMANPAALKGVYAEFTKRKKEAEDAVAKVGPAKDIEKLRAAAEKDRAAAAEELVAAKAQAKTIIDTANVQAGASTEAAQLRNSALDTLTDKKAKEADALHKRSEAALASANAIVVAAEDKHKAAADREAIVAKREADVKIAAADNAAKAALLKEIREKIISYLAAQTKAL